MVEPTLIASVFSGGGTAVADVVAIAIAVVTFIFLFWAIDLIDRI
jgi:hypothetical protein